jgi:hypothetical protein
MKKLMFFAMYLGSTSLIHPLASQELPSDLQNMEMRHHRHHSCSDRHPISPTGATGPQGPTGQAGATGSIDVAWAYSQFPFSYPFVDISAPSNLFFIFEQQFPSSDIIFTALPLPNLGTMVTFLNTGSYLVEFSVAGELLPAFAFNYYLVGVFQGTSGATPNTLSNGNLFESLVEIDQSAGNLTNFLIIDANANDTIALGNATAVGTQLFLQQGVYSNFRTVTTSTTAEIKIIRLQ